MSETAKRQVENLKAFMAEEDSRSEEILRAAEIAFGHPMRWPVPPRQMPRWYELSKRRALREAETWFGPLAQADLDAFWQESAKGQSVYEDAGGYKLRCYRALVALPTEEPYTYRQAADDLASTTTIGER